MRLSTSLTFLTLACCIQSFANPVGSDEPRAARNRLANESSPYLLQHAGDPVDWYPWGEEALEKAKRENKPILLSIGYAACHWCHVMGKEAFSDEEIAQVLNERFVCIKVDREERPDIDHIYMTGLQVFQRLSRSGRGGGWPLTLFLTPDGLPMLGGTYFPPRDGDRGIDVGFLTLIKRVDEVWRESEELLRRDATLIADATRQELAGERPDPTFRVDESTVTAAIEALESQFDPEFGGFGYSPDNPQRPKFPEPSNLQLLLARWELLQSRLASQPDESTRTNAARLERMIVTTLDRLQQGGIHDAIGGGFHRYSVDRKWQIPHFEKMLYDNAQLLGIYAHAAARFKRDDYRRTAERIADFLLREMRDERGLFYSSLDADSEGEEGTFYVWSADQLRAALTPAQLQVAEATWEISGEPNFENERFVLVQRSSIDSVAQQQGVDLATWRARIDEVSAVLFQVRAPRVRPATDDKIVTAWNGLAIRGFADAGRWLERKDWVEVASNCANAIHTLLRDEQGLLHRTLGADGPKIPGYLDDHALLVDGLIALHTTTGDAVWLERAIDLTERQFSRFHDSQQGGFFVTAEDHASPLARPKDPVDGVIPSGNSVSATNLLALAQAGVRPEGVQEAESTMASVGHLLGRAPEALPWMVLAIQKRLESAHPAPSQDLP